LEFGSGAPRGFRLFSFRFAHAIALHYDSLTLLNYDIKHYELRWLFGGCWRF